MGSKDLTLQDLRAMLPSKKNTITQELVDVINDSRNDPEFQGTPLIETAITYEHILKNHKTSVSAYIRAIKFCAYLIATDDVCVEAYKRTFSDREFVRKRLTSPSDSAMYRELTSAATRYHQNPLVVELLTASQAPLDLMFTGARYKCIGVLADLAMTAKLDRDRINAAKELLAATARLDKQKVQLEISTVENTAVQQLNNQLAEIAAKSLTALKAGDVTLDQIGAMTVKSEEDILEGELVNDKN